MKAVDTNVLVRFLVQDDPAQGRKAAALVQTTEAAGEKIFIGNIVLCELVWVLDSAYGYAKSEIAGALDSVLQTGAFAFENKDIVRVALEEYRNSKVDFADCLIGRTHRAFGCETTVTFDAALRKLRTFSAL